ncbi:hypothetical protein FKP32DRAFT_1671966 [Trametes sanguinea]|nr:hypothetical protein FKP32DRAFT_1671966 [Trametes sanguinea]
MYTLPRDDSGELDSAREAAWMNRTFGSVLVGCYLGFIIYGLNLHQAARYYKTFPKDHIYLKLLVASVLFWETWHTAFAMYTCYHYLVANYFNSSALLVGYLFFMRRVYLLVGRRSKILIAFVVLFLLAELGLATASSAETFIKTTFKEYAHVTWIISVAYGMAAVADAILTTILICALRRCRTGMQRTDSLLDVLILYAISTGLLTCVFDLATFLVTLIQPSDFVWFAVNIVATKVYPASLLAALNTRQILAEQSNGAAAIYGGTEVSPTFVSPTRSAFRLSSWAGSGRPHPNEAATGSEVIEMDVKADCSFTEKGAAGTDGTIIEIGPLGRTGSHAESS